ncbi:TIGR01620 family protein [Shinella sp. CPCC 101442]|uniref:YcjF family protein n=1 Tax=Shinella sp. CPCC 101442 TaxID=2932265 RepID=UPI0021539314|nr:TIGR01620 family protein [Shinella sp. CPCC 101442]MCR6499627.1 TIGR01620 family protein [Shinella sp. CPCC 101442]
MNDRPRKPAAFSLPPDATVPPVRSEPRKPAAFDSAVTLTPDADDPFIATTADLPELAPPVATPRPRRLTFGRIAIGALGLLLSLAVGLWVDALIRDLFSRNDWLGYLAIGATAVAVLALIGVVLREVWGIRRLAAVQDLKRDVTDAMTAPKPAAGRAIVARLVHLLAARPQTARGRARLAETEGEIIDSAHLVDLAERELMAPLDREARALILGAAKRVSIVTAVSPRALVDLGYVIYESSRLVRGMAELYGGRPGKLGMLRLMRDVIAHLAVTGSIAMGDSLVQQLLGHGLASKLSARLGEGVINGLMTARIGIAAMDLCRPMPFRALKRPGIGDFIGDLTPGSGNDRRDET